LNASLSKSPPRVCAFASRTGSTPRRMVFSVSHAAFAVSLMVSMRRSSGGTPRSIYGGERAPVIAWFTDVGGHRVPQACNLQLYLHQKCPLDVVCARQRRDMPTAIALADDALDHHRAAPSVSRAMG
jgi:hypothetical protein